MTINTSASNIPAVKVLFGELNTMDCPVCRNAMITLELSEVEIDHCLECNGIWLDAGELEMLLGDSQQAKGILDSFKPAQTYSEKPRKCPICLKKMQKIVAADRTPPLLLDRCAKGDGLWFDKGELQDIFTLAQFDTAHKVQKILTDMFKGQDA